MSGWSREHNINVGYDQRTQRKCWFGLEEKQKCSFELEGNRRASLDLRTCKSVNLDYNTQQKCRFGLENTAEVSAVIGGHNGSVCLKWKAQQNRRLGVEDTTEGRFGSEATTEMPISIRRHREVWLNLTQSKFRWPPTGHSELWHTNLALLRRTQVQIKTALRELEEDGEKTIRSYDID